MEVVGSVPKKKYNEQNPREDTIHFIHTHSERIKEQQRSIHPTTMSGMHLSKEFFELLKAIGESKSKQEEDRIIQREIATLRQKLDGSDKKNATIGGANLPNALNANKKKAKEFLLRLLYVGKFFIVLLLHNFEYTNYIFYDFIIKNVLHTHSYFHTTHRNAWT